MAISKTNNISTLQYNTERNSTISTVQDSSSQYSTQHAQLLELRAINIKSNKAIFYWQLCNFSSVVGQ